MDFNRENPWNAVVMEKGQHGGKVCVVPMSFDPELVQDNDGQVCSGASDVPIPTATVNGGAAGQQGVAGTAGATATAGAGGLASMAGSAGTVAAQASGSASVAGNGGATVAPGGSSNSSP